jgi:leucyl aminopeptidase
MSNATLDIVFQPLSAEHSATTVVFATHDLTMGKVATELNTKAGGAIVKAAEAADFKGKAKSSIELLALPKIAASRVILMGAGKTAEHTGMDWEAVGGAALGAIQGRKCKTASIVVDIAAGGDIKADAIAAHMGSGALLRHYTFKKYQSSKKSDDANGEGASPSKDKLEKLIIHVAEPDKAKAQFERHLAVAKGIYLARDLVNEPANELGPVEFANRCKALEKQGLDVEILDADDLKKLKMNTLLAVAQGSDRPARVAIMTWNGAKSKKSKPLCFVGKGVTFDTGGISIKGALGMEDMKGDMGGAACVTGLMLALAQRKAPVNAVGIIGIVENMLSGNAVRPGDIVTSMSGQTVEIINTDAEGRLVLADVLWYAQERFKPKLVINLATLTGAIMVALGKEYAGMFANDETLAADLTAASKATGEKVWRMPLDKCFDKLIESRFADMKNIGGRWAGACTAAAFLERFIEKDMPWCHLDIAGPGMDGGKSDISTSWGSGWGIRLLDRYITDNHEKADK